jgi:hypothetical protein
LKLLSLLLIVALFFSGINCQSLVLAALYSGNGCGSAVNASAYIPINTCLSTYIPNVGVYISLTAGSTSGTVSSYTGVGFSACVGTPSNSSFTIGSCFQFPVTNTYATIFSSSQPLWSVSAVSVNSATNCNNPNTYTAALVPQTLGSGCSASFCVCGYGSCSTTSCQTSQPNIPGGTFSSSTYNDSKCQNLVGFSSSNLQGCVVTVNATVSPFVTATSVSSNCNGNTLSSNLYIGNTNCQGTPTATINITGGCTQIGGVGNYYQISCGASCFHRDTEIIYKDEKLTLDSLNEGKHPSCTVPHVYTSAGVKISTSCSETTLRLTTDHLVYTQRGLLEAKDVQVGDLLFQDLEETKSCKVISAEKENSLTESYFGLNCEESVVLANGFKTSTFGKIHFLPSLWMRIMTPLIGVRAASAWGDYLSHLVQRYKLF